MEDINAKIDALEEKRLAAYYENQKIREQIDELKKKSEDLYREEFRLSDEITEIKTGGTKQFLGKYVKVKNEFYIYVTSVTNEYNSAICAFSGPHFSLHQNGFDKRYYWFTLDTGHESAHHNAATYVKKPEDVTIITREEFIKAYDECMEQSRKHLVEALNMKPIGRRDNEYVFENPMYDVDNYKPIEEKREPLDYIIIGDVVVYYDTYNGKTNKGIMLVSDFDYGSGNVNSSAPRCIWGKSHIGGTWYEDWAPGDVKFYKATMEEEQELFSNIADYARPTVKAFLEKINWMCCDEMTK